MVNGNFSATLRQLVADYDRRISESEKELSKLKELRAAAMVLLEHEVGRSTKDGPAPSVEKPYAGMTAIQAAEMVIRKHGNQPLHADNITREIINGGWLTQAKQPRYTVVGSMSRDSRFENVGGNKFRLKEGGDVRDN